MSTRDRDAVQLRAIAPLINAATKQLIGPVLLVTNGPKIIAVTSTELLRPYEANDLAIAVKLDGSLLLPVATWGLGRYSGIALGEIAGGMPSGAEVTPLPIGAVCATVDTRNAPSALAVFSTTTAPFVRDLIPVQVDSVDTGGGMSDDIITRLASPIEAKDVGREIDGAILFTWFPPDPVLGRKSEVLAVALAYPYVHQTFQPRANRALAELIGLDDLGRALISASTPAPARPELHEVTGEIAQVKNGADTPVLDPLEEIRRRRERG